MAETYTETTRAIVVSVRPVYLEDESAPEDDRHVWAYHVHVENRSRDRVQLINRYWRITDALGQVQEVRGVGVVGEQPVLEPGEAFAYTSGVPLSTPSGIMVGCYEMEGREGVRFKVAIPAFSLDSPFENARVH